MMPIRVLLADDHPVVRRGLRILLEEGGFLVAGEAADGQDAVRLAAEVEFDVAILDLSMPHLSGLDVARALQNDAAPVRIVLLTRHDEPHYVAEALRAGVHGYVLKNSAAADLVEAVLQVARGGTYLSPRLPRAAVDAFFSGRT
jgi:DNA-binding NarL/FixJ family response regulator